MTRRRVDPRQAWTLHWQTDRLNACVPQDPRVQVALQAKWRAVFDALEQDARVLDLGTGNGSLAVQAVRAARDRGRRLTVDAVDAAAIDPPRHVDAVHGDALAAVRFHAGTPMETLPFTDAVFDLVVGQYAFEYADTCGAAAEAVRVLRPGGRLRLLVHTEDAALIGRARAQRACLERVQSSALFDRCRTLLEQLVAARRRGAGASPRVQRAIAAFKAELDRLRDDLGSGAEADLARDLLTAVEQLPAKALAEPARPPRHWIDQLALRASAQIARFHDLEAACLDAAGLAELLTGLEDAGFAEVVHRPARLDPPGVVVGGWIAAARPPLNPG